MSKSGFIVDLMKLKDGAHEYDYKLDGSFFKKFGDQLQESKVDAKVQLTKMVASFACDITVRGEVTLNCDRCLSEIQLPVNNALSITLKLTDDAEVLYDDDNEIISIPRNIGAADISQHLYDMVLLALPIKRVCENSLNRTACDQDMIDKLTPKPDPADDEPDPRWAGLRKLLDN